jgi:SAM-dependent methyltransferase
MADWTEGYVADIEYSGAFYRDQSPSIINLACLVSGIEPLALDRGIAYVELGCGQGHTTAVLAAANPASTFIGVDFNPAHIARARALAAEAGIANLRFIEASFADLAADPAVLGRADMVTLHGIYSWISPENRRAVVSLCGACLEPGGLLYVSYNALPGWLPGLPIQRLIADCAALFPERSDVRVDKALDIVAALHEAKAPHLALGSAVEDILKVRGTRHLDYLAHEYLNGSWSPMWHADVRAEMAAAKLEYAGSARLLENFDDLSMTPAQREVVARISQPALKETLRDFCMLRSLRKDVFVRGARRMSGARRTALLGDLTLALVVPPEKVHLDIKIPAGEGALSEAYRPILAALAEGPCRVGALLDLPEPAARSLKGVELVGMLVGSGQAMPTAPAAPTDAARAFNRIIARRALEGAFEAREALVAPVIASGVNVGMVDRLGLHVLASGTPDDAPALRGAVLALLADEAGVLHDADNRPLPDQEKAKARLEAEIEVFVRESLPLLRRLGAL